MCKTLEVSRSGFYAWLRRTMSDRAVEDKRLTALIFGIHDEGRGAYGSPRVHRALQHRGVRCSRKRVARLMAAAGLSGKVRRRFRPKTTDSKHDHPIAPDLVQRDFQPEARDKVWVSDITYIATDEGWLYLATTMDLFSRRVVGWSMSESLETTIVLDALAMAIGGQHPDRGLIHHSDRGSQYASDAFRNALKRCGARASMSRTGNCYDNAVAESFYHSLKTELPNDFATRAEARAALFDYIEAFYNRFRLHSTLGYRSPADFEGESAA